jgi:hypothetical protein
MSHIAPVSPTIDFTSSITSNIIKINHKLFEIWFRMKNEQRIFFLPLSAKYRFGVKTLWEIEKTLGRLGATRLDCPRFLKYKSYGESRSKNFFLFLLVGKRIANARVRRRVVSVDCVSDSLLFFLLRVSCSASPSLSR